MTPTRYRLFFKDLVVDARIGIHDFERRAAQRLKISLEIDIDPARLPSDDAIRSTFDYDWVRDTVKRIVANRHFDLQETLVRTILDELATRPQIVWLAVETAKPDVYPDVAAVGCRIEAGR